MWDSVATVTGGRGAVAYNIRTASSLVSNVEFGKVERTLSKKLNSTAKVNPDMCIDLTVRMETSTCVADAANWGNIELAGTKPTYRPTPQIIRYKAAEG